ncbi:transposase [Robbsia andropogonis]|uniref:transposase n=1 Tax=Robbsia andropogonis TaxID=28092 RepID=UPI0020A1DD27|nr:transposase [Robbsia andropogonis]MCP1118267.1 transposase [Robbsia andropogonis]MCP1127452.1 transposase [Robbsia andropogonis]
MYPIEEQSHKGRTRRTYSREFRSDLVAQSQQLGMSCSALAISHGMNPNVLRRWIKESGQTPAPKKATQHIDTVPAFIPLPMAVTSPAPESPSVPVRIEVQRNGITIAIDWPAGRLDDSAAWVREILR